jgi:glycosyltransferase involved in cell wall biosynthesis
VKPPLVSVIVPTRDRPQLVAGAVRSALDQAGVRVEVCVVDDASAEPVVLPADERVRLIRLEPPARGPAAARNAGLAATTGELVAFLDDDDVWLPGKLARQVEALVAAGPGTVMVASGFELWDGERLVASALPPPDLNSGGLLAHPCVCPSAALARREAIVLVGGFDESLIRVEDWDLWLRLADQGTIEVLPEVLADRRWQPLAPEAAREARASIAARIEPRLAELPADAAARLRTRFRLDEGVLLTSLGRRREAVRVVLAAWRDHPGSRAAPLRLARALTGERAWQAARQAVGPARARLTRARRPPRPPGPAPRWAGR